MIPAVFLVGASTFSVAAYAMFVSGMFPDDARPAPMRGTLGSTLIGVDSVVCLALVAATARGLGGIDWPYAVVAGGLGMLLGPLAYQGLPRAWQDTPRGASLIGVALLAPLIGWLGVT